MARRFFRLIGMLVVAVAGLVPTLSVAQQAVAAPETVVHFADTLGGRYMVQPNLTYSIANNVELKVDLYLPQNTTGPVPLVMFFHGGGWVEGRKESAVLYLLPYLQMGFAVANVAYRLGRVSPAPAAPTTATGGLIN